MTKILQKAFILPLIVFLALAVVVYKVKTQAPIAHERLSFPIKSVDVITLKKLPFRNRAIAYGHVEPAIVLNAKTEVSGKISYIHPFLKKGASLPKDTIVLKIEPTAFEFSLDQSKAGLSSSQYSLTQLEVEEKSTRRLLEIAQENLRIGKQELARLQSILKRGLVARSSIDEEQQQVLQLSQQVEDLQGRLDSYASRKSSTEAQIKQSKTQLAQSEDTLGRTEIRLPFDARIGTVAVEKGEYISTGNVLFEALGTESVEVNAQIPVSQFYPLIKGFEDHPLNLKQVSNLQAEFLKMKLQTIVRLVGYEDFDAVWKGQLLRIGEAIDPQRDTISLVVAVNKPYDNVIPGVRPPLLKGMYAEVEFFTPVRDLLVIPRKALHQGRIYVANADNKLEIRAVNVLQKRGDLLIIESLPEQSVQVGERIIISDVVPVIEGLPLKPIHATEFEQQLAKNALSEELLQVKFSDKPVEMGEGVQP